MLQYLQNLNTEILYFFAKFGQNEFIEKFGWILGDGPLLAMPIFMVFAWIYFAIKKDYSSKKGLLYVFYASFIALFSSQIIKLFVKMDRPEFSDERDNLLLSKLPELSFPSDHSITSFAFLFSLYFFGFKKSFKFFLIPIILMAFFRIILGHHWPFDVLAGFFLGSFSAFITYKFLKDKKVIEILNNFLLKIASFFKL